MESFLEKTIPHVHDKIYDLLDVRSRRNCLVVSKTMRKFIEDRYQRGKREERLHNWLNIKRPEEIELARHKSTFSGRVHIIEDIENVYLIENNYQIVSVSIYKKFHMTLRLPERLIVLMCWVKRDNILLLGHKELKMEICKLYVIDKSEMTIEKVETLDGFTCSDIWRLLDYKVPSLHSLRMTPIEPIRSCELDEILPIIKSMSDARRCVYPAKRCSTKTNLITIDEENPVVTLKKLPQNDTIWEVKYERRPSKVFVCDHGYCVVTFWQNKCPSLAYILNSKNGNLIKKLEFKRNFDVRQVLLGKYYVFFLYGDSTVAVCEVQRNFIMTNCQMTQPVLQIALGDREDFLLALLNSATNSWVTILDTSSIAILRDESNWNPRMNKLDLISDNSGQKHSFEVRCLTRDGIVVKYRTKFNGRKELHYSLMLVNKTLETFKLTHLDS